MHGCIPYKTSVRKVRCVRSIILEAFPGILRSRTRDPQTGAATWQPIGAKKGNRLHSPLPRSRSVKTMLDCPDHNHESVEMIVICIHLNSEGRRKSPKLSQKTMIWGQTVDGRSRVGRVAVRPLWEYREESPQRQISFWARVSRT